jgi:hypothetical protein
MTMWHTHRATLLLVSIAVTASVQLSASPEPRIRGMTEDDQIVGRVVGIVPDEGLVGLATAEGVVVVRVTPDRIENIDVGDTVTFPKSATESPSAPRRE